MNYIRIREWAKHQHYKDRNPPWIKLHRELLGSPTWVLAQDETKLLAVAIMLLAAQYDNKIPADKSFVRQVAHLRHEPDFQPLILLQFIEIIDESGKLLSSASISLQNSSPETETETEEETPSRSSGDSRQDSGELTYEPIPEPEPEPSTPEAEPPKPVSKPKREPAQKPSAAVDPRFTPMRDLIERCCKHAKVDFIWDASEAKQLNAWLKAVGKNIPADRCLELIRNRFRSDEPLGRRPREWIPHLSDYATPIDRFGKPRAAHQESEDERLEKIVRSMS